MNTIRVYIDEKLDAQQLEHLLMGITHVIDTVSQATSTPILIDGVLFYVRCRPLAVVQSTDVFLRS